MIEISFLTAFYAINGQAASVRKNDMKRTFLHLATFLLLASTSLLCQTPTPEQISSLKGYWLYEGIDSSYGYQRQAVQKMFFTEDSLTISDFGSEPGNGQFVSATTGTWTMDFDTVYFYPKTNIIFSFNTGTYYPHTGLFMVSPVKYVVKKLSKDELSVAVPKWFSMDTKFREVNESISCCPAALLYKKASKLNLKTFEDP